jgi:Zn-dependent protease with chaperone function
VNEGTLIKAWAGDDLSGTEPVEGTATLDFLNLGFTGGDLNLQFPTQNLRFHSSETGEIVFRHPDVPNRWIVAEAGILSHPVFQKRNELRAQLREWQQSLESKRGWKLTGIFLGVFIALSLLIPWLGKLMVRGVVARVPVTWEEKLDQSILEDIRAEAVLLENPELVAHLNKVIAAIQKGVPRDAHKIKILIALDPTPNAHALPGGTVVVNIGLLENTPPEQIAGVLAHELGHVTARHGLRTLVGAVGPALLLRLFAGDEGGLFSLVSQGSHFLVVQSVSRDHEREADELAWRYLTRAKIEPNGLRQFLERIQKEFPAGELPKSFSSHPPTPERIARLEELSEKHPARGPFQELPKFELKDDEVPAKAVPVKRVKK